MQRGFMPHKMFILGLFVIPILGPAKPDSPNWPQFRGRNCSGIAAEKANPPVEFGLEKNIKWKIALPPGHSSPSIWG